VATLMAAVLVVALIPLAIDSADGEGSVESVLVLYWLTLLTTLGLAAYSVWVLTRAVSEFRRWRRVSDKA